VLQLRNQYLFTFHTLRKLSRPCVYQKVFPVTLPYSIHSFVLNSVLINFPPPYSVFQHTQTLCWSYPML